MRLVRQGKLALLGQSDLVFAVGCAFSIGAVYGALMHVVADRTTLYQRLLLSLYPPGCRTVDSFDLSFDPMGLKRREFSRDPTIGNCRSWG